MQVGHIERFNPAIRAMDRLGVRPRSRLPLLLVQMAAWAARASHLPVQLRRRIAQWRGRPSRRGVGQSEAATHLRPHRHGR